MQRGSSVSQDSEAIRRACVFCQPDTIANYILKETPAFRLVADHAPLVEGHILIISRQHYPCYGAIPAEYDAELATLKDEVRTFFAQFYAPPIFWEHGIYRQTVFHAHLHCFPFGKAVYDLAETRHSREIHTQDDIRAWHEAHGHYFYLQDNDHALLFSPNKDDYMNVIQNILRPAAIARHHQMEWKLPEQRQIEGRPLIASLMSHWHAFERRAGSHVDTFKRS